MRTSLLLSALLLSACVTQGMTTPPPPDIVVTYRDLALKTPAGRAELVQRVDRAVRSFCGAYDPQDKTAIFAAPCQPTALSGLCDAPAIAQIAWIGAPRLSGRGRRGTSIAANSLNASATLRSD